MTVGIPRRPPARLADLNGRTRIAKVLDRDDEYTELVCELAANGQREWDYREWLALLAEIERETVSDFLVMYGDRGE